MPGSHPIYSRDATVWIETGEDKLQVMQWAIDRAGFLESVEAVYRTAGKPREQFLIAIKPNIMTASVPQDPSPVYTDPELVEFLMTRLRERGYQNLAVVEARNVYDYSYQGRNVAAVARIA